MDKLRIYQDSLVLVKSIYTLINLNESLRKDFALGEQLKRAAISVPLNIAEGYGRGIKHYRSFLRISIGSTNEVITALRIVTLIYSVDTASLQQQYYLLAKQISSFSNAISKSYSTN